MAEAVGEVIVAAVQMTSGSDVARNLSTAADSIARATARGAALVVLPENFAFMGRDDAERAAVAEAPGDGPIQRWAAAAARDAGAWIVAGTVPVRARAGKFYSTCLVFDASGEQRARYDKIHLFDVSIPGRTEHYQESAKTLAGCETVVTDSPLGGLGLAVCYDLRFPEQFRRMLSDGMRALALPAAFTAATGAAHWNLLVRARAVENLCPVIAAAQGGRHESGRVTWGHSMIVDAWGTVLAECGNKPDIAVATLNGADLDRLRTAFPAVSHRRL